MRILIVSQYFAPESFRINDLVKLLSARGHEVSVLTGMPNYPGGRIFPGYGFFKKWRDRFESSAVFRVPIWPRGRGGRLNLSLNYSSYVASATLFGLPRLRGRFDCSFVFAVSPITSCLPAIFFKWITGTPVVLWVQDLWPESVSAVGAVKNSFLLRVLDALVKFIYRNCDLILIQSEAFRPEVLRRFDRPERVRFFPNWAEDLYKPVERSDVRGPAERLPNGFRVVFAGNIGRAQAVPTLLAAAERLRSHPEIQWIVVGDGTERASAERLAKEKGLTSVHFVGRHPMEEMPNFFAMADALIVTLSRDPIFSKVVPSRVQSYLACGRPIVAALDGEGQRVILESGAGFAGASEDAFALAENVLRLYEASPESRMAMGSKGLAYYREHFSPDRLIPELESSFAELAAKT